MSLIFAVLTTTTMAGVLENTLVRPGVKVEGVARVTAGTSMTAMWREEGASAMPLEVRMGNMSQILATDNVLSGAQAILPTRAVKMDLTTTLGMKEGAQEARSPSFGILEL